MEFKELQDRVIDWAEERDIFNKATPIKQLDKTMEEYLETRDEVIKYLNLDYDDDGPECKEIVEKVKDGIGDQVVTLIILSKMFNFTIEECLEFSYDEIKDRKGKMVDGIFVKES